MALANTAKVTESTAVATWPVVRPGQMAWMSMFVAPLSAEGRIPSGLRLNVLSVAEQTVVQLVGTGASFG